MSTDSSGSARQTERKGGLFDVIAGLLLPKAPTSHVSAASLGDDPSSAQGDASTEHPLETLLGLAPSLNRRTWFPSAGESEKDRRPTLLYLC